MANTNQLAVIDLAGHRAASSIRTGQLAWNRIKATAAEQRTLWLEVGEALMYGKMKENREGLKFSEWVREKFPGLTPRYASAAIWVSENSAYYAESLDGVSDPIEAQRMSAEKQATQSLPEDLQAVTPAPTLRLPKEASVKVNKLAHRASTGDEGSAIADRMLKAFAKTHGVDLKQILEAAAEGDPEGRHRFPAPVQASINTWRSKVQADVAVMERTGISKEAIKHLLINLAHSL